MLEKFIEYINEHRKLSLGLVFLLAGASYSRIFANNFVMDDLDFIVNWPLIRNLDNVFRFFVYYIPPDGQIGIYSPLKTLFHALTFHFFELNPAGYHAVALTVHALSIIFVYRISFLLAKDSFVSFLCALFFAVHPVATESIVYMTASIDTIGILFLFISVFYYIRNENKDRGWSILFGALAVFTHELAISLPILLLFYEAIYQDRRTAFYKLRDVSVYVFIVLAYAAAKFFVLGGVARGDYVYGSFYLTMLIIIKSLAKYVLILIFPLSLTVNHVISNGIFSYDTEDFDKFAVLNQSIFDPQVLMSIAFVSALVFSIFYFRNSQKHIAFCIGWLFISLLPVLNIIPTGVYFGERYLYPGLFAFAFLLAVLIRQKAGCADKYSKVFILIVVSFVSFYCVRTYLRVQDWKNETTFYESIVRNNPKSAFMNRDLGLVYLQNNKLFKAVDQFEKAARLQPYNTDILFTLGDAYTIVESYEKSQNAYIEAINIDPQFAEAYYNLAGLYAYLGDAANARRALDRATKEYRDQGRYLEAFEGKSALESYFGEKLNKNTAKDQ